MRTSAGQEVLRKADIARWGLGILVLGGLFLVQDLSGAWLETLLLYFPGGDKILHGLEFFAIFLLLHWLAARWGPQPTLRLAAAAIVGVALAAADEVQQGFTATRSVELADFAADACGLALGAVAIGSGWRTAGRVGAAGLAVAALAGLTADSYLARRDFNLGLRFERQGHFALARQAYLRALGSGLESAALYNSLGWVEVESGEGSADKAIEYAAKALALRPGDADILDTYGWALHNGGRSGEALPFLIQAEAKKPRMFCIHYHLGMAYLAVGSRQKAAAHLRKQLEVSPQADESRRATLELERLR